MQHYREKSQLPRVYRLARTIMSLVYPLIITFVLIASALLVVTALEADDNIHTLEQRGGLREHITYLFFFYGMIYLGCSIGQGIFRLPAEIYSHLSLPHCISTSYFNYSYASAVKAKVLEDIEEKYTTVNALIEKFSPAYLKDGVENRTLDRIIKIFPVDLIIDIESSYRFASDRDEKFGNLLDYIKGRQNYSVLELEGLEAIVLDRIRLYRRAKLNYYKSLLEVVYWEEVEKSVTQGHEYLASQYTPYFSRPVLFQALPELEMLWYHFLFHKAQILKLLFSCFGIGVFIVATMTLIVRAEVGWTYSPAYEIAKFFIKHKTLGIHILVILIGTFILLGWEVCRAGLDTFKIFRQEFYLDHTPEEAFLSSIFFRTKLGPPLLLMVNYILMDPEESKPSIFSTVIYPNTRPSVTSRASGTFQATPTSAQLLPSQWC